MNKTIMIVDDERYILNTCKRLLMDEPFDCIVFDSPMTALQKLEQVKPAVIISDQRMAEMDGVSFLSKVKERLPESVRIIMTGYADIESAILSINQGQVFRFLKKPWADHEFKSVVLLAMEYYKITSRLNSIKIDMAELKKDERLHGILEMSSAVCHEFSQPLQVISGYCCLMKDFPGILDDKKTTKEYMAIILDQIDSLAKLLLKVMTIDQYTTKPYTENHRMVDIENSSSIEKTPFDLKGKYQATRDQTSPPCQSKG